MCSSLKFVISFYLYISTLEGEDILCLETSGTEYSGTQRRIPQEADAYSALLLETITVVIHESVKRHIPVSKTLAFGAFTALAPGQSLQTL